MCLKGFQCPYIYIDWLGFAWFDVFSTYGGLRSSKVGQKRETDEEHDEDVLKRSSVGSGKH